MQNNKRKKNTTPKSAHKPLPKSSIIGKRKEVFNLNLTKGKKRIY